MAGGRGVCGLGCLKGRWLRCVCRGKANFSKKDLEVRVVFEVNGKARAQSLKP